MSDSPDISRAHDGDDAPTVHMRPTPRTGASFHQGTVLAGRYRIESYLAAGGMGQVYSAHDLTLDVPLALKTIRPEIASNAGVLRRFKQEVLLARSVTHPNVCHVFDLWHDAATDVSFLTMEFLPGETLTSRITTQGALPSEASLPLVHQMADALDAAHRAGIIHRDFKSPNVMLVPTDDGERAVITDFGLAMSAENGNGTTPCASASEVTTDAPADAATQTLAPSNAAEPRDVPSVSREIVGTPAYMSPEQVTGAPVGPASDLYALGVVLFEMCTGRVPFRGATPIETARAHLTSPPPRPSKLVAIDDAWEETILRLLSKDPAERYATAHDAMLALEGRANGKETARYSLPAEHDAFIGRTTELEALIAHLEGPSEPRASRLLTLSGLGGIGKTRLAQKYGWERLSRWPGGVWYCDLSEARSVDGIARAVATALSVPLGKGDPVVQLGHAMVGRGRSLVILDNFEQVAALADATLGRWLERTTETRFLVTSRERLGFAEEAVHPLALLDSTTHGVELFEVRAQGHRPGFAVNASNRKQVEAIVDRLEGVPLAIELAAARLRMLSLEQLRDQLEDWFKSRVRRKRGRHETLTATLDWVWALLEPWEQSAIAQASIFEGGFTLEAAETVIDLSEYEEAPVVLGVIQSLVDKNWLRTKVALGAPRFAMYSTVQEYVSARLRTSEKQANIEFSAGPESPDEVEVRHGAFFARMGTVDAIAALHRHAGVSKRAALHLELDNLVAACRRAVDRENEEAAAETYVAAAEALTFRGPFSTSIRLGLDVLGESEDPTMRGRVLGALSLAERLAGKMEEAREHSEVALAIHREMGNRRFEGAVLSILGAIHRDCGRMVEAREHYEAALSIHREEGNRRSEGHMLGNLGLLHAEQGRIEEAREHYEAALAIHREVADRRFEGIVLNNLGAFYREHGRMDAAREHYEAALAVHRKLGDRRFEGIVLGNLGAFHREQGRMAEAREHYEAALAIHREVGNRRFEGAVLGNLGLLHSDQGRMEEARDHYEAALVIHREVDNRNFEGQVLGNLGLLRAVQGRMEEAREYYEAALTIHRKVGDRRFEGIQLDNLGAVHAEQGRLEEARRCFDESTTILRDVNDPIELGKALCSRGEFEVGQGDVAAARTLLAEAESIAADLAVTPESGLVNSIEELRDCIAQAKKSL